MNIFQFLFKGGRNQKWLLHIFAAMIFVFLVFWHFKPLFPVIKTHYPGGGTFDVYNFVAAPLTTSRAALRNPLSFWKGDRLYPYPFSTTLLMVDFPFSFSYHLLYKITSNAILSFNLYALLFFFINGFAVYLLIYYWTRSWLAGIIAGAFCTFFPHRFHSMEVDVQLTYISALGLLAWLAYLRRGGLKLLILFFFILALKVTTPDYQTIFLAVIFGFAVPLGFVAYPDRLRTSWKQFIIGCVIFVILMLPFLYPYYAVLTRLPGHGYKGVMFVNIHHLTAKSFWALFTDFFHNISHLRIRYSNDPRALIWPGAILITTGIFSIIWGTISPFLLGKKAVFRIGIVLSLIIAGLLTFTNYVHLGSFGKLSRLYVDPPLLSTVRQPCAFIYSINFCLSILIGLLIGNILTYISRKNWMIKTVVFGFAILILIFGTLEHTVKLRSLTNYKNICKPTGVYAWLNKQKYPSPFIRFPYTFSSVGDFTRGAYNSLADQPSAFGRSRYVLPMQYYFKKFNKKSAKEKAAMIAVSPYKFWVENSCNEKYRKQIEQNSNLKFATNFGRVFVFENPNPERVFPIDIIVTQKYQQCFPNIIYSTSVEFEITNKYSFVPKKNRKIVGYFNLLDKDKKSLAKLKIKEKLPFILDGQNTRFGVHVLYNANKKRLEGSFQRYNPWQIANAPITMLSISEKDVFKIKFIEIKIKQSGIKNETICLTTVSPTPSRWPYKFGLPTSYCNQAGGFSGMQEKDGISFQLSGGKFSTLYLPKPQKTSDYIMLRVREAMPINSKTFSLNISLNGKEIGKLKLEKYWKDYKIKVPKKLWKKLNRFDFYYPETALPCLYSSSRDEKKRCAAFAELSVFETPILETKKNLTVKILETIFTKNLIKNGSFSSGLKNWYYWQTAKNNKSFLNIFEESGKKFLRIYNPKAKLIGLVQNIPVKAGKIYKLSGEARSVGNNSKKIFGGRLGFYIPNQKEKQIIWMFENNNWQKNFIIFTNKIDATASIFVHLGYGNISATGDFKNISLQEQEQVTDRRTRRSGFKCEQSPLLQRDSEEYKSYCLKLRPDPVFFSNIIHRISLGKTNEYSSVFDAFRKCKNNDKIIIYPGTYYEKNYGSEWLICYKKNVKIIGKGNPQIVVKANSPGYQISMQLPYNSDLFFEGVRLKTIADISNNKVVYNAVFTGGKNINISNCVFEIELNGTNSVCKNFVAVNNATNVVICSSEIITRDKTGNNQVYHFASHDAAPLEIKNVTLRGKNLENLCIGKIRQTDCQTISE